MNTIKKYQTLLLLLLVSLSGCIEEFGSVGEPFNRPEQMTGTWGISEVVQIDNIAVEKGYPAFVQQVNITQKLPYSQFELTLNADGSFAVTTGDSPNLLTMESGNWAFDNPEFPSMVSFSGDGTSSALEIGALNTLTEAEVPTITFNFAKYQINDNGGYEPFLTYRYTLVKK